MIPRARGEAEQVLQQAEAYKKEVVAKAEGEASRFLAIYNEYKNAKQVTQERMYLETMEKVLLNEYAEVSNHIEDAKRAYNSIVGFHQTFQQLIEPSAKAPAKKPVKGAKGKKAAPKNKGVTWPVQLSGAQYRMMGAWEKSIDAFVNAIDKAESAEDKALKATAIRAKELKDMYRL